MKSTFEIAEIAEDTILDIGKIIRTVRKNTGDIAVKLSANVKTRPPEETGIIQCNLFLYTPGGRFNHALTFNVSTMTKDQISTQILVQIKAWAQPGDVV